MILLNNSFWTSLFNSIVIVKSERLILQEVSVAYNCLLPVLLFSSAKCLIASCTLGSVKGISTLTAEEFWISLEVVWIVTICACWALFCNRNCDFIFKSLKLTTGFSLVCTIGVSENFTKGVGCWSAFCSPLIWKFVPNSSFFFPHLMIRHLNN